MLSFKRKQLVVGLAAALMATGAMAAEASPKEPPRLEDARARVIQMEQLRVDAGNRHITCAKAAEDLEALSACREAGRKAHRKQVRELVGEPREFGGPGSDHGPRHHKHPGEPKPPLPKE